CMSNDLRRKTVTLETDIGCLHRRNLRPTRNAANCEPINVTTPLPDLHQLGVVGNPGRAINSGPLIS
ncbi:MULTISPECIES: hypothetical protein, partial [Rhizobium/Agrobacterium group]|uniref:hypothetical protein n=1 Tax=Rhizobium/Agrobacterium group TaxID=227290 RepID=UPI001AECD34E